VCGRRTPPTWAAGHPPDDGYGRPAALDRAVARVASGYPDLGVEVRVRDDTVAGALVDASPDAALVVLGSDARVHYGGLLAGLVSIQVAAHARAPVIVVPGPVATPSPGRIVVGVDDSPGSAAALDFAFDEARTRDAPVHAVHVWDLPTHDEPRSPTSHRPTFQQTAERMLDARVAVWLDRYPATPATREAVRSGNPVRVLNDAATGGALIVVGRRGHGGFASLALGSVSDGLVRYAGIPIAVV
jgi:nucleotide-binding universal stress UspA family protein